MVQPIVFLICLIGVRLEPKSRQHLTVFAVRSSRWIPGYCHSLDHDHFIAHSFWWRSWLRHCATSRKVAGSIPDGVSVIFHLLIPSACTVALGSTQPLTEVSTINILPPSCVDCLEILGPSISWSPQGLSRPVIGQSLLFQFIICSHRSHEFLTASCNNYKWVDQYL